MAPSLPDRKSLYLAVAGASIAILLAIVTLWLSLPRFFDPCLQWVPGDRSSGSFDATSSPGRCPATGRIGSSKAAAAAQLAGMAAILLSAAILGLGGSMRCRPRWTYLGSGLLFLASVFAFSAFPLTVVGGVLLLLSGRKIVGRAA